MSHWDGTLRVSEYHLDGDTRVSNRAASITTLSRAGASRDSFNTRSWSVSVCRGGYVS